MVDRMSSAMTPRADDETTPLTTSFKAQGDYRSDGGMKVVASNNYDVLSNSPWWSNLFFGWLKPLLEMGNAQKQLDPSDVLRMLPLPYDCGTEYCMTEFDRRWKEEEQRVGGANVSPFPSSSSSLGSSDDLLGDENNDADANNKTKKDSSSNNNNNDNYEKEPTLPVCPSLARALAYAFGLDFCLAGLLKLVHDLCIFVGPNVLNKLILFLKDDTAPLSRGIWLTVAVTMSQVTMSFCLRHYFYRCYRTGLRIRTAVVLAVYRKALRLSAAERQHRSVGEIVNLVSVDANRMQNLVTYLHAVWYSFVQIGLAMYFLWQQLGASCLAGCAVIVIMMPVTKTVAKWMGGMQKRLMAAKDARVEVNSEVLGSMKVIKLQSWEEPFQDRLLKLRRAELDRLFRYIVASSFSYMLWSAVPLLVSLSTFAAYALSGHKLDVASSLTSLALFEVLRFPLFMLPNIINNAVEASVSISRVQSFLMCDEQEMLDDGTTTASGRSGDGTATTIVEGASCGVRLKDATFVYESKKPLVEAGSSALVRELNDVRWQAALLKAQLDEAEARLDEQQQSGGSGEPTTDTFALLDEETPSSNEDSSSLLALKRINFSCQPGELVAIVGHVGSGKSTFIQSLLSETRLVSGAALVKGKVAYFPQSTFIMNDTIRNNILFSHRDEPVDEARYQRAVSTSALEADLRELAGGDQTEIGEKGITLSGGQKARVTLARAVYHDADLYLLDDPLAAVDAHVGKHLFQECVINELMLRKNDNTCGETKKRTVLLVTNALQYLSSPYVDRIVVLKDGRITEEGSYEELSQAPDSLFASFLSILAETGGGYATNDVIDDDESSASAPTESLNTLSPASPIRKSITIEKQESIKRSSFDKPAASLMTDEFKEREVGHISIDVYASWAKASGGIISGIAIIAFYSGVEGINVLSKWWLTHWSEEGGDNQMWYLTVYALINMIIIFATFGRIVLLMTAALRASKRMYDRLLDVVLQAPMSFFDTTPTGRVINRFSSDIYTLDEDLAGSLRSYLSTLSSVISTIVVVSFVTPLFILCLIPIIIFYLMQQAYFTITYRELKRLDSITRSPIVALLAETIDGVDTIRAFRAQRSLFRRILEMLDKQQNCYYLVFSAQCWLAIRLEMVGTVIILLACLFAVSSKTGNDSTFAGLAGLSISYALSVTQSLNWSVRMSADIEANFVAVERIEQYSNIPREAPRKTPQDILVDVKWPREGEIRFEGAKLRYRKGLPLVLKGLNLVIPAQSKIGVVGRTGAGKSTLMVALLRIVELDAGVIKIDNVDIASLGLKKLRSRIAVIPQDPVLFSGTVRTNLDPFDEYSEERLYEVLDRVGLLKSSSLQRVPSTASLGTATSSVSGGPASSSIKSLAFPISEGGSNLSVGQRQLLVIARALLNASKIVIMDEATASVDADTDARIQRVMRSEFSNSTVITVAHRINTILDSDYILVMESGKCAEFDSPETLLKRGGMFRDLVEAWEKERDQGNDP